MTAPPDPNDEKAAIVQLSSQGHKVAALRASYRYLAKNPHDLEAYLLVARCEIVEGRLSIARMLIAGARGGAGDHPTILAFERKLTELEAGLNADPYRRIYLASRVNHMDFPEHIQIETVGRCNAKCVFCPHEQLDRKFDEMDDGLYEKIITDASVIPSDVPVNFLLNVVNEPFMDKKIFDRVAILNQRIPHATFGFNSNMNVLPKNFFEKLEKTRGLNMMNVSFNAANRAEYEDTMGIDFNRTIANLKALLQANQAKTLFTSPLVLSRVQTFDQRDEIFVRECQEVFADFRMGRDYIVNVKMRASWLGEIISKATVPHGMPCLQWLHISVHCDGTIPHCCMDATGQFSFGNARDTSIIDIYNSPRFRNMREAHTVREPLYPCNTCELR